MENNPDNQLPSLANVLRRINQGMTDFSDQPAKTVFDRGFSNDYPLHKVAIWGDINSAVVLISNGADVNALGEDGDTPLHRAIAVRHAEMAHFLISKGADAHLRNRYGNSPLDDARDSELDLTQQ